MRIAGVFCYVLTFMIGPLYSAQSLQQTPNKSFGDGEASWRAKAIARAKYRHTYIHVLIIIITYKQGGSSERGQRR